MERPLEIVFHNLPPSQEIERLVREKVVKLQKFYPRLIGCRVAIELPHKAHRTLEGQARCVLALLKKVPAILSCASRHVN